MTKALSQDNKITYYYGMFSDRKIMGFSKKATFDNKKISFEMQAQQKKMFKNPKILNKLKCTPRN